MFDTPGPDQEPEYPSSVGGSVIGKSVSQIDDGSPDMKGITTALTKILCEEGNAHCPALGVNVNVIIPFCVAGLKVLFETPGPDQIPVIPICKGGRGTGGSVIQTDAGIPEMAYKFSKTVMDIDPGDAQIPASGVKVNMISPFNPDGLKVLFDTPDPAQLPLIPLWDVGSAMGELFWHRESGIPVTEIMMEGSTKISDVAGRAH